jgi:hypothetical protein
MECLSDKSAGIAIAVTFAFEPMLRFMALTFPSSNPFTYVRRTISQLDPASLTIRKKLHSFTMYQPHVCQIQNNRCRVPSPLDFEDLLQLGYLLLFDPAAQG